VPILDIEERFFVHMKNPGICVSLGVLRGLVECSPLEEGVLGGLLVLGHHNLHHILVDCAEVNEVVGDYL